MAGTILYTKHSQYDTHKEYSAGIISQTAGQQIRQSLVAAVQASQACAGAAGFLPSVWGSTTVPHVFSTPGSPIAHQNRGRLPFVVFIAKETPYDWDTQGGGEMVSNYVLQINVGGANQDLALFQAESLMATCMAAIRSEALSNYLAEGQQVVRPFTVGPLWHTMEVAFTIVHQFGLANFEAT
jgi:hypothetical protein